MAKQLQPQPSATFTSTVGGPPFQADAAARQASSASPSRRAGRALNETRPSSEEKDGFISQEQVQAHQALRNLRDIEPSVEEMAGEQGRIDRQKQAAQKKGGRSHEPAAGRDLLASYLDQLSSLPLFTPIEEQRYAKELEEADLWVWQLVLAQPRAVVHLIDCLRARDDAPSEILNALIEVDAAFRRAAARSRGRVLHETPMRHAVSHQVAKKLRTCDFDKELLEALMGKIRPEVWGRRVHNDTPSYRLTHADLTAIEQARGSALRTRNLFVRANLRLVVSVARNFHHYRIPFIDLLQEGNVGLMKAVHRFDYSRGFRFSTYAHWWIRQSIERAIINKGSQVRLPVHVIDARRQLARATQKLTLQNGRAPSYEELAQALSTTAEKVEQTAQGVVQDPISLDESIGGEDPRKFLDLMRDDEAPRVDEALIRENTHARVRELLHLLNPIEKDILRRRFGLGADTDSDQTLDEIGKLYNLSRERVRQIQAQGLAKMRRMCERRRID